MSFARARTPIAMIAAAAIVLLSAIVGISVPSASATNYGEPVKGVCSQVGDRVKYEPEGGTFVQESGSHKLDVEVLEYKDGKEPVAISVTAPDGYVIEEACVKAGPNSITEVVDPAASSVVINTADLDDKKISHFAVKLVDEPGDFDWNWEYPAPTCEGILTVTYPEDLPDGQSNHVNIRVENLDTGDRATINIHLEQGTWSGTQDFDPTTESEWPGWDNWAFVWTQVAGSNYHWEGSVEVDCDKPEEPSPGPDSELTEVALEVESSPAVCDPETGETTAPSISVTQVEGLEVRVYTEWQNWIEDTTALEPGTYGLAARPLEGYTLTELPDGWHYAHTDYVKTQVTLDDVECDTPEPTPSEEPTPGDERTQVVPPVTVEPCVAASEMVTVGEAEGVTVVVTREDGSVVEDVSTLEPGEYTITATLDEGYEWSDELDEVWEVNSPAAQNVVVTDHCGQGDAAADADQVAASADGELPQTGATVMWAALGALLLVAAGTAFVLVKRRRA